MEDRYGGARNGSGIEDCNDEARDDWAVGNATYLIPTTSLISSGCGLGFSLHKDVHCTMYFILWK